MRETLRAEKLYADLDRLRHLVATDTYMSATRQLGQSTGVPAAPEGTGDPVAAVVIWCRRAIGAGTDGHASDVLISRDQRGPESLDVRWR